MYVFVLFCFVFKYIAYVDVLFVPERDSYPVFHKEILKMLSSKWRQFCLGLMMLKDTQDYPNIILAKSKLFIIDLIQSVR